MVKVLLIILGLYVLTVATLVIFQRSFLYHPTKHILQQPPKPFVALSAKTSDHLTLTGWYSKPRPGKPTLLYFHGNGATIEWRLPKVQVFIDHGYGIYLAEYRGYGGNPGHPTEVGLKKDALAHYDMLKGQGIENVITYGESLGTHLALYVATQKPVAGVILENAYTSIPDIAKKHYPIAAFATRFVRDQYDSLAIADQVHAPVLQIHAELDKTVPISFGKTLHEKLSEPKTWATIDNVGHNNIYETDVTVQVVIDFIDALQS